MRLLICTILFFFGSFCYANRLRVIEKSFTELLLDRPGLSARIAPLLGMSPSQLSGFSADEQAYLFVTQTQSLQDAEFSEFVEDLKAITLRRPTPANPPAKVSVRSLLVKSRSDLMNQTITAAVDRYVREMNENTFFPNTTALLMTTFRKQIVQTIVNGSLRLSDLVGGNVKEAINATTGAATLIAPTSKIMWFGTSHNSTFTEISRPGHLVFTAKWNNVLAYKPMDEFPDGTTFALPDGHYFQVHRDVDNQVQIHFSSQIADLDPLKVFFEPGSSQRLAASSSDLRLFLLGQLTARPASQQRNYIVSQFIEKFLPDLIGLFILSPQSIYSALANNQVYIATQPQTGKRFFLLDRRTPDQAAPFSNFNMEDNLFVFSEEEGLIKALPRNKDILELEMETGDWIVARNSRRRTSRLGSKIQVTPLSRVSEAELSQMIAFRNYGNRSLQAFDSPTPGSLPDLQSMTDLRNYFEQKLVEAKLTALIRQFELEAFLLTGTTTSPLVENLVHYQSTLLRLIGYEISKIDEISEAHIHILIKNLTRDNVTLGTDQDGNQYFMVGDGRDFWLAFQAIGPGLPTPELSKSYQRAYQLPSGTRIQLNNGRRIEVDQYGDVTYYDRDGSIIAYTN